MTEQEKGRVCPRTQKWCPDCRYTCKVDGLIAWVQGLTFGNDSFTYEPTQEQLEKFLNKLDVPSPDPEDDENLGPFKDKFGGFL